MPVDPELLQLLACPSADHAALREDKDELICTFCASRYRIEDGIPVLLLDEATPGPNGIGNRAQAE